MKFSNLCSVSPLDGRYKKITQKLSKIFSEYGFIKYKLMIEIFWLKYLSNIKEIKELKKFDNNTNIILNKIINNFNLKHAYKIKKIEKITNHDVKSIVFFLKKKLSNINNSKKIIEFIHFGCTSEDINNIAYALMLKDARRYHILKHWKKIIKKMDYISLKYKNIVLLSRTHGQPATPSTMGKEIANFSYRLKRQYNQFKKIKILGKFNGTVGNYNAHVFSYPNLDWININKNFVKSLNINWNPYTTQIEPHDYISEFFSCIFRFNTILINFNRDIWGYISLNYFKYKFKNNEIGSSTMPHKINPIDFENSEGNLGISNALIQHISFKLPISRWQRDLSDSTVLRNLGSILSYSIISYHFINIGIKKIKINKNVLKKDLNNNLEILLEPIQIFMRKIGIYNSYEKVKLLFRGKKINKKKINNFINTLNISDIKKKELYNLTPFNYIGKSIFLSENIKLYKY
ncbi:MAG: adenylosuccinate lyase [Buchnera aphidicola (Periphyllus lyropictus)]|uniref:adenylosuccinate lyase n=1 Tax=Buchnera aphidicola TaxID=9 RepID=UPI001EBE7B83|nr:adenylosuccinate lyase [Buchnera aphidicola]NIH16615.1 adenylosuccinate lyase [Buchnera aphidicola (Periphyllus lyropictus)]USS94527.1 adenylosuccinate lyase [Buchnera aphidicola (Periphyllus lyropictus)]